MAQTWYLGEWRPRTETPPAGLLIWVSDGREIWLLAASGEPFPKRATACKYWAPALVPTLPDGLPPEGGII